MNNTQRTVDECRIQKVGDNMTTTKTSKISLNIFDDKRFYANSIKSYPHDENLYLFKRGLIKKICERTSSVVTQQTSFVASQAGSLIKTTSKELDNKDINDNKYNKDLLINKILELTTNDDRKSIKASIRLYNDLRIDFIYGKPSRLGVPRTSSLS